jgi:hypothetical protein
MPTRILPPLRRNGDNLQLVPPVPLPPGWPPLREEPSPRLYIPPPHHQEEESVNVLHLTDWAAFTGCEEVCGVLSVGGHGCDGGCG